MVNCCYVKRFRVFTVVKNDYTTYHFHVDLHVSLALLNNLYSNLFSTYRMGEGRRKLNQPLKLSKADKK